MEPDSWMAFWPGSDATAWDDGPGPRAGPADVRRLMEFARHFLANSHDRSAQTGIGSGRTLVRIGQLWAALLTALFPVAEAPFFSGHVAATRITRQEHVSHPGAPVQGSVSGAELMEGFVAGLL